MTVKQKLKALDVLMVVVVVVVVSAACGGGSGSGGCRVCMLFCVYISCCIKVSPVFDISHIKSDILYIHSFDAFLCIGSSLI